MAKSIRYSNNGGQQQQQQQKSLSSSHQNINAFKKTKLPNTILDNIFSFEFRSRSNIYLDFKL